MVLAEAIDFIRVPVAFAFMLVLVVGVHEAGHFILGKLFGIRVDEFSLGFGPKLLSRRRGETLYAIRALPLGGFVRLAGMTGLETGEADAGERNFIRARLWQRGLTILAGGLINLIFAGLIFGIVRIPGQSTTVIPDLPASQSGIQTGDLLTSVEGRAVNQNDPNLAVEIRSAVGSRNGAPVRVDYTDPQGAAHTTAVTPFLVVQDLGCASNGRDGTLPGPLGSKRITAINGSPVGQGGAAELLGNGAAVRVSGYLIGDSTQRFTDAPVSGVHLDTGATAPTVGSVSAAWLIGFTGGKDTTSPPVALFQGLTSVPGAIADTFRSVKDAATQPNTGGITGCAGLSGPVGIVVATTNATHNGVLDFVGLVGLISLSLGIMNLLPIPFLDGGRLLFVVIEAIRRRPMDPRREAMVHFAGLVCMVLFVVYITVFGDIRRLFQ